MALGIGFGAERIGLAALRWPKIAAALLFVYMVIVASSLPFVKFDDDIHRVFLTDSPTSQAQIDYRAAQTPAQSTVLIHVETLSEFNAADLMLLRDFTLDLEFIDGVLAVASPFSLRFPPNETAAKGTPVFDVEITEDYRAELAQFRALNTGLPSLINAAQSALLISVQVDVENASILQFLTTLKSETALALPTHLKVSFTGEDVISQEIVAGLKNDLIALNFWGSLIVGVAALLLLRDLRMVVLSVVPALCGAASVLALSVWLSTPINVLSNVIPILLLVLGVADGVHLAGHLKSSGEGARATVQRIGPACALTALTTALAFACISITDNAQLFEFAVLGALGTLLAFAVTITVFALLALVIAPNVRAIPSFATQFAGKVARVGTSSPKVVLLSATALLILCTFGYQQTKGWFPLYQNLPGSSTTVTTNDAIARDFGGVFQMIVDVEGDWRETTDLADKLSEISGPEAVLSEVGFARWLGGETRPTAQELSALPADVVAQLRPDKDVSRIFIAVPEPMRDEAAFAKFDALTEAAQGAGAARIFGLPSVMRQEAVHLISQLSLGLILASLGATLVVALAFGNMRLFPLLLLPNILPLMVTGASLHIWAAGQLSPTAVLALTISFGIAIDDSVHFLNRFFEARQNGACKSAAVHAATRSAGQVMVLTTVLLTFGLAVTMISDFFPIRLFGGMMILTLWAALLFDLLLMPALFGGKERPDV